MMDRSECVRVWLPAIRAGSGADVFTERLADSLRKAGHHPVLQWFDRRLELTPWVLARVKAPPGIDLIHAGSWQGFAFKRRSIPLVITEHQYIAHPEFARHRPLKQALYHRWFIERCVQRSYAAADALVTVSDYCATAMRQAVRKQVRVVHNWVDTEVFSPGINSEPDLKPFKLLFVGNPSRWKGADLLPLLAQRLRPHIQILCVGGLRKEFDTSLRGRNISHLNSRPPEKMPDLYRSANAALVLARYEAFGYVALEAMACGLPVVGFATSGTAEICANGETALLASPGNVEQLAAFVHQLADQPQTCSAMGRAGRERACEFFGEKRGVDKYIDIYNSVSCLGVSALP